jgi:hypothetical protein
MPLDRKTVLLNRAQKSENHIELIDADTLETLAGWTKVERYVWTYSGNFFANTDHSKEFGPFLFVRKQGEDWRPVSIPFDWECSLFPEFVAEKLLVQSDCNGTLFWVNAESATWSKTSLGKKHRSLDRIRPSHDGNRFAASLVFWKFIWSPFEGHGRFGWEEGVQVWDVSTRQLIFTKEFNVSWLLGRVYEGDVALSADGTRLAILDRRILEVYDLPPPSSKK